MFLLQPLEENHPGFVAPPLPRKTAKSDIFFPKIITGHPKRDTSTQYSDSLKESSVQRKITNQHFSSLSPKGIQINSPLHFPEEGRSGLNKTAALLRNQEYFPAKGKTSGQASRKSSQDSKMWKKNDREEYYKSGAVPSRRTMKGTTLQPHQRNLTRHFIMNMSVEPGRVASR